MIPNNHRYPDTEDAVFMFGGGGNAKVHLARFIQRTFTGGDQFSGAAPATVIREEVKKTFFA